MPLHNSFNFLSQIPLQSVQAPISTQYCFRVEGSHFFDIRLVLFGVTKNIFISFMFYFFSF